MKIVNSNEMRDIEGLCNSKGITNHQLMENAGLAFAEEVRVWLGGVAGINLVVLIGPGNNGGDGLVAARHLHDWGANVYICLCAPRSPDDTMLNRVIQKGIDPIAGYEADGITAFKEIIKAAEIIVDALLGTGMSRPIKGHIKDILSEVQRVKMLYPEKKIVALDIPSGIDPNSGQTDCHTLTSDMTVALAFPKIGMFAFPGADKVGYLRVADIGIPSDLGDKVTLELLVGKELRHLLPTRPADGHKGTFGRLLALVGSTQYLGAAYLACMAATRVGAGLVTLACDSTVRSIVASRVAEITYLTLDEYKNPLNSVKLIGNEIGKCDALLVGCGLGQTEYVQTMVQNLLIDSCAVLPQLVVDADGLNSLSKIPQWWDKMDDNTVLTPHPGEMARLMGTSTASVQHDRLGTAREAARQWRKVVVLKGAHSVICHPDGRAVVSPFANPGLASAGTGDVLAGVIAGFMAQGLRSWESAIVGVFIHGKAGEIGREEVGAVGMVASDLLIRIPKAISELSSV